MRRRYLTGGSSSRRKKGKPFKIVQWDQLDKLNHLDLVQDDQDHLLARSSVNLIPDSKDQVQDPVAGNKSQGLKPVPQTDENPPKEKLKNPQNQNKLTSDISTLISSSKSSCEDSPHSNNSTNLTVKSAISAKERERLENIKFLEDSFQEEPEVKELKSGKKKDKISK